jgi:hypothetical protein
MNYESLPGPRARHPAMVALPVGLGMFFLV